MGHDIQAGIRCSNTVKGHNILLSFGIVALSDYQFYLFNCIYFTIVK